MTSRSRPRAGSGQVCCPASFSRQPPRILIVDTSPPWWLNACFNVCEALDDFLTLASCLEGPCRLPLLSLYAVSSQTECLLPFVQVRGNLARLRSCVEELRSMPREGTVRPMGGLLRQAVQDSLLQFKQYLRHMTGDSHVSSSSVEVTVLTCQPGGALLRQLEAGLKDTDLLSLRRLLLVCISQEAGSSGEEPGWSPANPASPSLENPADSLMLGAEMDLQQVENHTLALESVFKGWLHDHGGDREHLHLLLPPSLQTPVCLKCDIQERLISPALLPGTPDLGANTETVRDFLPPTKGPANQGAPPHRLTVIKALQADGICESVLYGLPLIIRPTNCWQLDWDEMEMNYHHFHALCHTLRSRDWLLLARCEPGLGGGAGSSHCVLQASGSLSLLLKPVAPRELLLPCALPIPGEDPPHSALTTIQGSLARLEEDPVFNPLFLRSNLYRHLRALPTRGPYACRPQRPAEGLAQRQPRQPRQDRQPQGRARATVAPLTSAPPRESVPPTADHAPLMRPISLLRGRGRAVRRAVREGQNLPSPSCRHGGFKRKHLSGAQVLALGYQQISHKLSGLTALPMSALTLGS
ncbi:meiosis 1 arrest protein [Megalops cyprinoides]|uniref:meiosis 1 arrest protein n=1 Tax=Megalops cyprinoides TaxID=118141 RepID=UPI001863FE29|nr:meiosis 1 arrest protein [Megalops cyprinoides]